MKTKQIAHHGWQGLPLRAGALALALASTLLMGCASPRESNSANVSPVAAQSMQTRQQIAKAMFAERCKTAGEKIHRTVENVEGIFLMKLRPDRINYGSQFELDDPYGRDLGGSGYIESFLRGSYQASHKSAPQSPNGAPPAPSGYSYVDAIDPKDRLRYRYTGGVKVTGQMDPKAPNVQVDLKRTPNFDLNIYRFVMDRTLQSGPMPRYGITYEDISTREEREFWIAGSSLKVIDLHTNEVIGERIGYMMDWAQGSRIGGRSPWLFAADHACPGFQRNPNTPVTNGASAQARQTQYFVEKILKSN